ncbi:MAG TPA: DUF302 domain-containing protein [Vicinamibacteria bacterium]|nr:DUF302 domain-containing protein [Vicinamibacteria bacterium]
MRKTLDVPFEEALARVPEALKAEGFGVLTEIDVQQTLKDKLGVDFRKYRILGACNPPFAHQALQAELEVGLLLPCNVIVYEGDDRRTVVAAVDPMATLAATDDRLRPVAEAVRDKLRRALDALG